MVTACSLGDLFFTRARERGEALALRHKVRGVWTRVSWSEYALTVRRVAAALLGAGLRHGDRVAILGQNRPEWLYCHLGTMAAGGATCGIYPTSSPEQVAYLLKHSETRVLFLEDEEQVEKALPVLADTAVERVVVWDRKGLWGFDDARIEFLDAFLDGGGSTGGDGRVEESVAAVAPDDTAMVIYTSGTTGPPKGAMLTHRSILFMAEALQRANPIRPDDEGISYLPFAHVYENLVSVLLPLRAGSVVSFVESPETLFANVREVSPTVLAGVPRVWEKLRSTVELRMEDSTRLKRRAFAWALEVGYRHSRAREGGGPIPVRLASAHALASRAVLGPLKRVLGFDRLRLALCGAAPASPEMFAWYHALGVPLLEGYGQTESSGVISVNRAGSARVGTVGEPLEGVEVRIAEDGEILARGPLVFAGYFKDPALTAETVDTDGWLHTGDVGRLQDGYLSVLDRKKDILITAGGKNVTPANIENALKWSPYIQDAVVVGEGRKYLAALILIDEEAVVKYAQDRRIPYSTFEDLARSRDVVRLIQAEVDRVNKALSQVEAVKRFALLPRRFYEEDGDVTPTKKVKRRALERRYADLVESLYGERP